MKRAFTLVELMISVLLLSLIVTFLYQSVAQLQTSNTQFLRKTDELQVRESLLEILYNDFINASSIKWLVKENAYDVIVVETSNSFHNMSQPFVMYKVYKEGSELKRIESPVEEIDFNNNMFRFNDIIKDVKFFKLYENKGHYFIYVKAEGIDDIYLDILPPSFLSEKVKKPTSPPDSNATNPPGAGA
jgi:prepilin-type N-terminal cleavage/methylation domain-containing protein